VLVTTPQEVALADVRRAKIMFDKVNVRVLGLVENMSYFICSSCNTRHEIFASGGGERDAQAMGIDFLGRIPLEPKVREGGDTGVPLLIGAPQSASAQAIRDIATALTRNVEVVTASDAKSAAKRRILPILSD
jgi:ATP-binding protein involved in chromosome partitioning